LVDFFKSSLLKEFGFVMNINENICEIGYIIFSSRKTLLVFSGITPKFPLGRHSSFHWEDTLVSFGKTPKFPLGGHLSFLWENTIFSKK
jgi:hypothetical protein